VQVLGDRITDLASTTSQIASDAAFLRQVLESPLFSAISTGSSAAQLSLDHLDVNAATVSGTLQVLGRTTLNDLGVTGNITAGILSIHGLEGEINTIGGPLKFQPLAIENIDFFNGKIVMDTDGNINLASGHIIGNDTFRGQETLPANTSSIVIDQNWATAPKSIILTPSYDTNAWVENITTDGFTIKVGTTSNSNKNIYWMAIW
jgi:hypothetical protein